MNAKIANLMIEAGFAEPKLAGRAHSLARFLVAELEDEISLKRYNHIQNMTDYEDGFNAAIDSILELLQSYD